jgi:hypothetical protein
MNRNPEGACSDWKKARELGAELGRKYHVSDCN